jgi:ribonucleoside-diphosphate reductase alpha chain
MARSVSVEDIKDAYLLAWKERCNGITVFRDGCKDVQVLNIGAKESDTTANSDTLTTERPFEVHGSTYRLHTPVGSAFITINHDEKGEPIELFINVGKAGSDITAMAQALGRVISTSLRFHDGIGRKMRAKEIAEQLSGIGGRHSVGFGPQKILSLPDAVAAALSIHLGLRVNGFGLKSEFVDTNHKASAIVNGSGGDNKTLAGAGSDLAGAVMSAQFSAPQRSLTATDDHTMASAESHPAPAVTNGVNGLSIDHQHTVKKYGDICPKCGASSFVYQEGCAKCHLCGYSEC